MVWGTRHRSTITMAALAVISCAAEAQAQPPPITDSQYTLQFFQGPVTSASRVIGLGGAYTALAEWTEGAYANPAAPAVRALYSVNTFDYDIGLGVTFPGAFGKVDFDNHGDTAGSRFTRTTTLNIGLQAQYGRFGAILAFDGMFFGLAGEGTTPSDYSVQLHRIHAQLGYSLLRDEIQLGVGLRGAIFDVDTSQNRVTETAAAIFTKSSLAPELGLVVRPARTPFRLGLAYRTQVDVTGVTGNPSETLPDGSQVASGLILPSRVVVPWELEGGVAFSFGPRPLNPPWLDPEPLVEAARERVLARRKKRAAALEAQVAQVAAEEQDTLRATLLVYEQDARDAEDEALDEELERLRKQRRARYLNWPREGVVLLASMLATGGSSDSVSVEGFLSQVREPYGAKVTISPRVGVEFEPGVEWLRLRFGTYLEPARYETSSPRPHATAGFDLKLVYFSPWGIFGEDPWRLRLAVDLATRYFNTGFSLANWH
jgi:hypothetical protein